MKKIMCYAALVLLAIFYIPSKKLSDELWGLRNKIMKSLKNNRQKKSPDKKYRSPPKQDKSTQNYGSKQKLTAKTK